MKLDIVEKIKNRIPDFSKGQKAIAGFILEHYDKASYITAGKLGHIVGVSESTVVRFAVELGFDGYPQMQRALREMSRYRLNSVQRMDVADDRIGDKDILRKVLLADIEKIKMTIEQNDSNELENAVDAIVNAKRVFIVGLRSSQALADFLGFYFNLMLDNVQVISHTSDGEIFEKILRATYGDVVLGISFPRYSSRTIQAMRHAKEQGAATLAVTDSAHSPLARLSDYTLLAMSDMASFVDSLVAPLSVINALIVAIGMRKKLEIKDVCGKLERIWEEFGVYESNERTV